MSYLQRHSAIRFLSSGILAAIAMTAVTACSSSPSETQDPALETSEIAASEPTDNLSDADIAEAVTRELTVSRGIEPAQVDVDVNRGIVTLAGTVNNILVKDRAERIASMVRGARSVVNNIEVTPSDRSRPVFSQTRQNPPLQILD